MVFNLRMHSYRVVEGIRVASVSLDQTMFFLSSMWRPNTKYIRSMYSIQPRRQHALASWRDHITILPPTTATDCRIYRVMIHGSLHRNQTCAIRNWCFKVQQTALRCMVYDDGNNELVNHEVLRFLMTSSCSNDNMPSVDCNYTEACMIRSSLHANTLGGSSLQDRTTWILLLVVPYLITAA
jgi:hypothetical protein